MKQTADQLRLRQLIVELDCGLGLLDVHFDISLAQILQSLRARLQGQLHPSAENHHLAAMLEQFFDVCDLNAWNMVSPGLRPIPLASTTGVKLKVTTAAHVLDVHVAPRDLRDAGGTSVCLFV